MHCRKCKPYKLKTVCRLFEYVETQFVNHDRISFGGNSACRVKYIARKRLICVVLRQIKIKLLVDFCDFAASGKLEYTRGDNLAGKFGCVVFVLNVAEDFLAQVLKCDKSCRTSELIDNDSHRTFLLKHAAHHLFRKQIFRRV